VFFFQVGFFKKNRVFFATTCRKVESRWRPLNLSMNLGTQYVLKICEKIPLFVSGCDWG